MPAHPTRVDHPPPRRAAATLLAGLLATGLLGAGCQPADDAWQSVAIAGRGDLTPFAGRWYDYGADVAMCVEDAATPRLAMRLPVGMRLVAAELAGGELRFVLAMQGAPWAGRLLADGPDRVVRVPDGSKPGICASCTPVFVRNVPASWLLERRLQRATATGRRAYDATWGWLAEAL